MSRLVAEWIWLVGGALWFVIRFPHQRRARKIKIAKSAGGQRDRILLAGSLTGLAIIPFIYFLIAVLRGHPIIADYAFRPWQGWVGLVLILAALTLFYETHRQLGRNWSVTLETRKKHQLVDTGLYAYVRHPMYSAFWLLALSQAFLLANWVAGLSGIVGFGLLFLLRMGHEERLMIDTFGREYEEYMRRTKRVVPWVY
jgi:protein-S-isoprenylcysteine O-methyltransferase Ste14